MTLPDAIRSVLGKYADFSGRARRSEFWYWALFVWVVNIVLSSLGRSVGLFSIVDYIFGLATLVPYLAVGARRLHDTGRSGWWQLLWVTLVGGIVVIIFWAQDSTPGANKYGPNPKEVGAGQAPQYAA